MKCSLPGTCIKMIWPYLPRGGSRVRQNRSRGWSPSSKNFFFRPEMATATNRIHSNDLEAYVMKCCCFWFHSVVKFFTLESSLWQKCSLYSGERSVPLGALVYLLYFVLIDSLYRYIRIFFFIYLFYFYLRQWLDICIPSLFSQFDLVLRKLQGRMVSIHRDTAEFVPLFAEPKG